MITADPNYKLKKKTAEQSMKLVLIETQFLIKCHL